MKRLLFSTALIPVLFAVMLCTPFFFMLKAAEEPLKETVPSSDLADRYGKLEAGFLLLMESGQAAKEASVSKNNDLVRTFLLESRRRNITGRLTELGNCLKAGSSADTLPLFNSLEKDFKELGTLLGMSPSISYPENDTHPNIDGKESASIRQSSDNNGNSNFENSKDLYRKILLRFKAILSREKSAENRIKEFYTSVESASGHLLDDKSLAELLAIHEAATLRLFADTISEKQLRELLSPVVLELSDQILHDIQEQVDFLQTGRLSKELLSLFIATIVKLKSLIAFLEQEYEQEQKESEESKNQSDSSQKEPSPKKEDADKERYERLKMARAMQAGILDKLRLYEKMKETGLLSSEQYRAKIIDLAKRQGQIKKICLP